MKKSILLLHGALGNQAQFTALRDLLQSEFEVFTFNFDGHDPQPIFNSFSTDLFTENTLDFIQENNLSPANIFGYSMGGYVALNLAKKYSEIVERIVTLATKIDWTPEFAAGEVRMLNADKIEEKVPKFADKLKRMFGPENWRNVLAKTADMMTAMGNGQRLETSDFTSVNCPVLITVGDQDKMVTQEESQGTSNALPNGQFQLIEGFQHPIERVDVEILAKVICSFIK